jgi:hypothetical protein
MLAVARPPSSAARAARRDRTILEDTLEPVEDPCADPPQSMEAVVARYLEAAPRYGREFVAAGASVQNISSLAPEPA